MMEFGFSSFFVCSCIWMNTIGNENLTWRTCTFFVYLGLWTLCTFSVLPLIRSIILLFFSFDVLLPSFSFIDCLAENLRSKRQKCYAFLQSMLSLHISAKNRENEHRKNNKMTKIRRRYNISFVAKYFPCPLNFFQ